MLNRGTAHSTLARLGLTAVTFFYGTTRRVRVKDRGPV